MKNILLTLTLILMAGCASNQPNSSNYDIRKVAQAAGKSLEAAHKATEFQFYNIPPGKKAEPTAILAFMRECHLSKTAGAIGSDTIDGLFDVLQLAISESKDEKFDGLILIIVGPKKDSERFDSLLLPRGIKPAYAVY